MADKAIRNISASCEDLSSISNWERFEDITSLRHGQQEVLTCKNGYTTGKIVTCDDGEWRIKEKDDDKDLHSVDEVKCPSKSGW